MECICWISRLLSSAVCFLWLAVFGSHATLLQDQLDMMAQNIVIRAKVVDNLKYNTVKHIVEISLTNNGSSPIPEVGWKLYFHSFFLVEPDHFPGNFSKTILLDDQKIRLYMIQGDLFAIEPQQGFGVLQPNNTKTISLFVAVWSISRTDFMPKWIIASDGLVPRVIESTDDQTLIFVDAFVKPRQWKRYNFDRFNPYTTQERARKFIVKDHGKTGSLILPTPREITINESTKMHFNAHTLKIQYSGDLVHEAEYLSNKTGVQVVTGTEQQTNNVIQLRVKNDANSNPEDYTLNTNTSSNSTQITGQSRAGVFYGIQSLLSIMASFPDKRLPDMRVADGPRYSYRGMHLDVSRNFHDLEDVKRLIRAMAMYKLNKLHLHLTDDEGWRLDIPGLPELTEVGGRRCFDLNETSCIVPQYGSGPTNETSGSGFFSVEDYRTILSYAQMHHIEVIPEFDSPGHARSAIRAMEQRYNKLAGNITAAKYFRLADANDTSQYLSIQMYTDNAINPCINSTYNFVEHVMREVYKMHQDIQPLKIFHFGGDEVANGAWVNSPACKHFLTQNPNYNVSKGLKKYFVERVTKIAQNLNLTIGGWEDGYMGDANQPFPVENMGNHNLIANAWDNVWEWGAGMRAYILANKGYKVIISLATHLYFDHPYEPDPEERGQYWASRFTDTKKTFGFIPDSIYDNIDMEGSGKPLTKAEICGEQMEKCDSLEHPENILGIQGQLWSETIRFPEHMDYMIFPRLLALAERAWHKASWEEIKDAEIRTVQRDSDWEHFANTLGYKELKRLDSENIQYRVPPPGGRVENSKINVTTTYPGLKVQYSNDGGNTWTNMSSDLPWNRNKTWHLRTVSASGTRFSRPVQLFEVEPVPAADQIIVDNIANNMHIKYDIIDNANKKCRDYAASLTLTNAGQTLIPLATWEIYLYNWTKVESDKFPYADGSVLEDCGLSVHFEKGILYSFTPVNGTFKGLKPAENIKCIIHAANWNVTDVMPNWYVTAEDMVPKVINSIVREEQVSCSQYQLNMMAQNIVIRAKVVDNLKYNTVKHIVEISLTNKGSSPIPEVGWKLYFHSFFLVEPDHFPGNFSKTILLDDQKIRLYMIQGDLFAIEPQQGFGVLQPNNTKTISIFVAVWSISRTDFMPKWIIASDGLVPRVIESTNDQTLKFVDAFVKPRQWKRYNFDRFNPYTTQERARKFSVKDHGKTGSLILPTPREITINESTKMHFNAHTLKIQYSGDLAHEAEYLSNKTGVQVVTATDLQANNVIQLQVKNDSNSNPEDYILNIDTSSNSTQITGQSRAGVFYGIQSLLSIMASFPDKSLPDMRVADGPRYSYRGMHLDVSRNFHDLDDVMRLIRAMAMYKLNKLHLHLTDDEGWRLEIPGLPELTEVGGRRCFDLNETSCIVPQYGSGPTNETSGSGFFSVEDYRTILSYAQTHHIEVIPEFDSPGHAHSAVRSMEQRYNKLAGNITAANYFRLADANDTSQYLSTQMFTDNAINPCINSTYNFVEHVMTEVSKMHQDIQPLTIFHFGGDEVANGAWVNSTACKHFLAQNPNYNVPKGLKKYFVERVTKIAQNLNLTIGGWEDGYMGDANQPFPVENMGNHNLLANAWDNVWEWGAGMRAYRLANKGYKVVISLATHLYFDHPYEPDPEERGLYWAPRYTDTKKTFGFIPDSIYDNIDMERSGKPLTKAEICGEQMEKCDPLERPENILGIQGQLWSETVRFPEHMDYMIFPRLLALAERAWHKASWEDITDVEIRNVQRDSDWESFANTLGYKELKRLDGENIKYRVPPPGGRVEDSKIIVTTTYPGLKVQYSNDGGDTWTNVSSDIPWNRNKTCHLRTVSASGTRFSRPVQLFEVEPVPAADQIIVDNIANNMHIKYDIIDNANKECQDYAASLTLTNAGQTLIPLATWEIYLYNWTKVESDKFPYADGSVLEDCGLSVHFEKGILYSFTPVNGTFKGLKPAENIKCIIHAENWNVTDVMPNWYVTAEDMVPKVINSIVREEQVSCSQYQLNMMAQNIVIRAKVVDNLKYNTVKHIVEISLTNKGSSPIPEVGWKLYFHSFFLVEPDHFPGNFSKTILLDDQKIRLYMIQGDLFAIEPQQGFGVLQPNNTKTISIFVAVWSISRTDFMPKWIIASDGLVPRVIESTNDQTLKFVDAFVKPRQWKRYNFDRFNPYTTQERARKFSVKDHGKTGSLILPTPREITINESTKMHFNAHTLKIQYYGDLAHEAEYLSNKTGVQVVTATDLQANNVIQLQVKNDSNSNPEDYILNIDTSSNSTQITGQSRAGVFYGIQSLLSIMASFPDKSLPDMRVADGPRYSYRGMHLDVSRNFHDLDDVMRLIRAMAMYKLNKLHLHLTDDEGWRLEIPGLPELTEVGGRRCFDLNETSCIVPQYGSGPTNETSGSGFCSVEDYRTILSYAQTHHIEVIPEFDSPGHAHSAVRSMEQRYNKLAGNITAANYFRLADANDTSQYLSTQMFTDNAINPCINSTYNFVKHVMTEVSKMHQDIQPLTIFHFGGDEVANGAWVNSTACKHFLTQNPNYNVPKGLKKYFVERVTKIAQNLNLTIGGWEDGYMGDANQPFPVENMGNHNLIANAWDNVWEWGAGMRAYRLANKGYKVVISLATHLYFDHPYEPDPEERGLYWAPRYTDTKKTFGFIPDSIYDNIDTERSGKPLTKAEICGEQMEKCDPLERPENILGIQGQLWSETVRFPEHIDYMIFPRLLALAERAWHKASWEGITDIAIRTVQRDSDWERFANTLGYKELKRLDGENIFYRVPPPGGRVENSKIIVTTTYPGLKVQYSNDGGDTWTNVSSDIPWNRNKTCHLRTVSASGTRFSRTVQLFEVEPIPAADQIIVDNIADNMLIKYDIIDNINKVGGKYTASVTLTNAGQTQIPLATWEIYFYSLTIVGSDTSPFADDLVLKECGLSVRFIEGTLYSLAPVNGMFKVLKPGENIKCIINAEHWNVARTDVMPNWYVTAEDIVPKVIKTTSYEELGFVGKYDTPEKWKRYKNDRYDPYTLRARYAINADIRDIGKEGSLVIPTPYSIKQSDTEGHISFKSVDWKIYSESGFEDEAQFLSQKFKFSVVNAPLESKMILIKNGSLMAVALTKHTHNEYYSIRMNKTREIIQIWATTAAGAFYGAQTLLSLSQPERARVPVVQIDDHPRFRYRGMMLDVARNFQTKEEVIKLLNVMAMYKFNTLQLHLADDEGWRIQISKLPELTQIGAKRCHDLHERECLLPAFGSGPTNKTTGSGYYTSHDYRDILTHAKSRHIKVIPDIGMPGHSRAAIIAMERRYSKYQEEDFRLSENNHTWKSDYLRTAVYRDSVVNPCMNSTFSFIEAILEELYLLHSDIEPVKMVQFGGDGVPSGIWFTSEACQKLIQDNNMISNEDDIKLYFLKNIARIAKKYSMGIASFGNVFMDSGGRPFSNGSFSAGDIYVYPTNNIWENGESDTSYRYANSGYKVILSPATHLFFDISYEPDPEERGFYWSTRYIDTRKVFGFVPDNIYANADVKVSGEELKKEEICNGAECLSLTRPDNIIGVQGYLWTDIIRSESILEHMAFPRIIALAERAWHKAPWEDTENAESRRSAMKSDLEAFLNTLGHKELKRLDEMNITYRIPPPGAIIENGLLKVNSPIPGLRIDVTPKGQNDWREITWTNPVKVKNVKEYQIRTRSADSRRYSRILEGKVESISVESKASRFCMSVWVLDLWPWITFYIIHKVIAQQ